MIKHIYGYILSDFKIKRGKNQILGNCKIFNINKLFEFFIILSLLVYNLCLPVLCEDVFKNVGKSYEVRVNTHTQDGQGSPSISLLSNNRLVIAWHSNKQDGDNYGIFACIINSTTGAKIVNEFQVNEKTIDDQKLSDVCSLGNRSFAISWLDGDIVKVKLYDANNYQNLTSELYVSNNADWPKICALSSELFAITWVADDGDYMGIYAKVFNATTSLNITNNILVNLETQRQQDFPCICALSNSTFIVAWNSNKGYPISRDVHARVFNGITGTNITREFQVNNYTYYSQFYPAICYNSDDIITIVWSGSGEGEGTSWDKFAKCLNISSLETVIDDFRVNSYIGGRQPSEWLPSLTTLSKEIVAFAWFSNYGSGDWEGSCLRIFNCTSKKFSSEEVQIGYSSHRPSVITLSNESFAIVWSGEGIDPSQPYGDLRDIYLAVFSTSTPNDNEFAIPSYSPLYIITIMGLVSFVVRKRVKKLT